MTEKRFNVFDVDGTIFLEDHKEGSYHIGEIGNVDVNCLNDIASRLNELYEEKEKLTKENKELMKLDENRKEYQRTLESKIRRLKDRIKVLEKR